MDSDLAVMMLSIYSCSVCTEDLPSMTCPQLLTNSWGLWPHTPRGQSQILGMLSGRADRVWLHSKECWCTLISGSPGAPSPVPHLVLHFPAAREGGSSLAGQHGLLLGRVCLSQPHSHCPATPEQFQFLPM